jgi:hypothetical protein
MAIPNFQAAGAQAASVGSPIVSWPTHVADDVGILMIETMGSEAVPSLSGAGAADWTELSSSPQWSTGGSGADSRLTVFWARADSASMDDVTVDDSGDHQVCQILTYRGCITTGSPINVTAGGNSGGSADTAIAVPGATTTVADCLVVAMVANPANSSTDQFTADDWANSDLSNVVAAGRQHIQSTVGNGGGVYPTDGGKATAGAYGTTTGTFISSVRQAWISLALAPPAAAAGRRFQPQVSQQAAMRASVY